jgi:hypothetical protein
MSEKQCLGSGSRPKLTPKKENLRNFMFEESERNDMSEKQCLGSGSRPKLTPKKENLRNFMFEESERPL